MRLIVDANVVVSALAKDGAVRAAIRTSTDAVFMPWYLSVEINEHRSEIRTKSGLSEQAFDTLLEELFQQIEIISRETIVPYLHEAARGLREYDLDDTMYAAGALAVDGTVVSNDQAFEKQNAVPHMWTSMFVERALGLNNGD
jgi:predicted nucleic acid-binding protein